MSGMSGFNRRCGSVLLRYAEPGRVVMLSAMLIRERYASEPPCMAFAGHRAVDHWESATSVETSDVDSGGRSARSPSWCYCPAAQITRGGYPDNSQDPLRLTTALAVTLKSPVAAEEEIDMSTAEFTLSRDGLWLTAMLRPAGELAGRAIDRFVDDIVSLAQRANIVVVNLVAATVPKPAALARALRRPGAMLSGPDQALLLVGADEDLLAELRRQGGDIATVPMPPAES